MKLIKPGNIRNILLVVSRNVGERKFNLSEIHCPVVGGFKYCKWCARNPVYGQKQYCSEDCKFSIYCFCYPQTFPATRILLERQNFSCATCGYSYIGAIEKAIEDCKKLEADLDWDVNAEWIVSTAKKYIPEERRIETDHIKAISNGGESFGLSNVEIKCNNCHKSKSSDESRVRNKEQNTYSGTRSTFKKIRDNKPVM
jgi:5-methylcytosine-specific restriction endonuclease McrA